MVACTGCRTNFVLATVAPVDAEVRVVPRHRLPGALALPLMKQMHLEAQLLPPDHNCHFPVMKKHISPVELLQTALFCIYETLFRAPATNYMLRFDP